MSNPNHIIIPIVRNKPTPQQLNVFQSSALCLTPQKDTPFSKVLVDKKYGSAFKRYKQKKERREQGEMDGEGGMSVEGSAKPRKPLKLKIRHSATTDINKNYHSSAFPPNAYPFYDPNEAPLFVSAFMQHTPVPQELALSGHQLQTPQEEIQVQLQQKIKGQPIEEELEMKYVEINFREDDPFIIVKKTNTKKQKNNRFDTNHPKTKTIKKEKPTQGNQKKAKVVHERQEKKFIPLIQEKSLVLEHQRQMPVVTCERPLSSQTKANDPSRKQKQGRDILSLHEMLKERSVDESGKSQDVQIMEEFLISRAGVMS